MHKRFMAESIAPVDLVPKKEILYAIFILALWASSSTYSLSVIL